MKLTHGFAKSSLIIDGSVDNEIASNQDDYGIYFKWFEVLINLFSDTKDFSVYYLAD